MKLFMFRWADGETSIVGAPTRDEAFTFVDCEWADPHEAEVTEIKRFAMNVKPKLDESQEGEYHIAFDAEIGSFGGREEFDPLGTIAYPLVHKAWKANLSEDETVSDAAIKAAFAAEMDREITPLIDKLRKKGIKSKTGAPMMDILMREWCLDEDQEDAA